MMKFSRSLRDRFQALRTPKRFIVSSAEFLRIFGAMIGTLKARAGSLRWITFLGGCTCSEHQPGDSDRDKSRRKS